MSRAGTKRRSAMSDERRLDARLKIELGGLVVKAGLRDADRALILGALIRAAALPPESGEAKQLRGIGNAAFAKLAPAKPDARGDGARDPVRGGVR